jgi:transposase-like protein
MNGNPMNLMDVAAMTEEQVREHFERTRWADGVVCPHCGVIGTAKRLEGKATRPGVWKCKEKGCRKQFTVTVGTIFHSSHITLKQWLVAIHLMASSKKGISALQLKRELGLKSYQSAWHLSHRVREAMREEPLQTMLKGDIEADEMYVGGAPRRGDGFGFKGRGTKKQAVAVLVQRGGPARARAIAHADGPTLKGFIRESVKKSSRIFTDEWTSYSGLGKEFKGGHHVVRHSVGEYSRRGGIHSNTVESFNGLFKRAVMGAWHHVSKQHIQRYLNEATFRWGTRELTDGERAAIALRQADGKRLMYRDSSAR